MYHIISYYESNINIKTMKTMVNLYSISFSHITNNHFKQQISILYHFLIISTLTFATIIHMGTIMRVVYLVEYNTGLIGRVHRL
jgi:hypothetical protein